MYIRITSRCNMSCEHCAFACTARGEDMSRSVFRAALKLAEAYGERVTLGGGEPTVHPDFWEFLMRAVLAQGDDLGPCIVTNGKVKERALGIARLAKAGVVLGSLSQDPYHEPISDCVVRAFTEGKYAHTIHGYVHRHESRENDFRGVGQVSYHQLVNAGRAAENGIGCRERCFCDELMVDPDGSLWMCGCRKRSFGTVIAPKIPDWFFNGEDLGCSERMEDRVA